MSVFYCKVILLCQSLFLPFFFILNVGTYGYVLNYFHYYWQISITFYLSMSKFNCTHFYYDNIDRISGKCVLDQYRYRLSREIGNLTPVGIYYCLCRLFYSSVIAIWHINLLCMRHCFLSNYVRAHTPNYQQKLLYVKNK